MEPRIRERFAGNREDFTPILFTLPAINAFFMNHHIVLIGAGSLWGPLCIMDFCARKTFDGSTIVLVDIHAERLHWAAAYARRIAAQAGRKLCITTETDLSRALPGASHVLVAVAVGGDLFWRQDVRLPQRHGVYQSVGDTVGPGGFFRGWRHMKFYEGLLPLMGKYCPDALLINLANPMNILCRFVERTSPIRCIGLCHGVEDSRRILAEDEAFEPADVNILAAGNNHFLFALDIRLQGRDGLEMIRGKSDEFWRRHGVLADFWRRFDTFTINYDRHPAEFVPFYLTEQNGWGEKLGVPREPREFQWREEVDPLQRLKALAQDPAEIEIRRTTEPVADLIELASGVRDGVLHLNIPNANAIPGVPACGNVEIPVHFEGGEMAPMADLKLPGGVRFWVSRTCEVQELVVDAFLSRKRRDAIVALGADALVNDYEKAERIFDALYAAQKDYLPELRDA